MTLEDGTELSPALGIGAFAEKTLVHAGRCTKVDLSVPVATAGLLGCGVMAGLGAAINTGGVGRCDSVALFGCAGERRRRPRRVHRITGTVGGTGRQSSAPTTSRRPVPEEPSP